MLQVITLPGAYSQSRSDTGPQRVTSATVRKKERKKDICQEIKKCHPDPQAQAAERKLGGGVEGGC